MKTLILSTLLFFISCSSNPVRYPTTAGDHEGPGCLEIAMPQQYNKIWALSDVHGQLDYTKKLLKNAGLINEQEMWQAKNELLIIVGDTIDKGPKSKELLDLWIKLSKQASKNNARIIHLLGNHEAEFLANPHNPKVNFPLPLNQEQQTFMRQMPMVLRLGDWLFVHSGKIKEKYSWNEFCKKADDELDGHNNDLTQIYNDSFLIGEESALEIKDWWKSEKEIQASIEWLKAQKLSGIVFGHQTKAFQGTYQIKRAPQNHFIKIDSGMGDEQKGEILGFPNPNELINNETPAAFIIDYQGKKTLL